MTARDNEAWYFNSVLHVRLSDCAARTKYVEPLLSQMNSESNRSYNDYVIGLRNGYIEKKNATCYLALSRKVCATRVHCRLL